MTKKSVFTYSWPELSLILLLSIVWAQDFLHFIAQVFYYIPVINVLAPYVIPSIFIIFILSSLKVSIKNIRFCDFLFVFLYALFYALNYVIYPSNQLGLSIFAYTFLVTVLPCYLLGVSVDINERIINSLNWVSVFCLIIFFFYYIFRSSSSLSSEVEEGVDFLTVAYWILPHVLFVLWRAIKTKALINIVVSVLGVLVLFSLGNRGSIICLLVFVFLYFMLGRTYKHPIRRGGIIISLAIILFLFFDFILSFMRDFTNSIGMSTRVFDMFEAGTMFGFENSSNRDYIANAVIQKIALNPFGLGIQGSTTCGIEYTHNIILDMFLEYGWFVGGGMLIVILFLFFRGLKECRDEELRCFGLLLICVGFVHLLFSHTYLTNWHLFYSFGFFIHVIKKKSCIVSQLGSYK